MVFNKFRNRDSGRYRDRDRNRNKEDYIPLGVKVYYAGDSVEQRDSALEKALQKFKKIISKEGLIIEMRERESFKTPGRKRYERKRKWLYNLKLNKNKVDKKEDGKKRNKRGSKNDRHAKT